MPRTAGSELSLSSVSNFATAALHAPARTLTLR
jgi:hypothetical protein